MPGKLGEDSCPDPVFRICAAIEILGEQRSAPGMGDEVLQEACKLVRCDFAVALPPHRFFGERIAYSVLVFGTATGMGTGFCAEWAILNHPSFALCKGMFVKSR